MNKLEERDLYKKVAFLSINQSTMLPNREEVLITLDDVYLKEIIDENGKPFIQVGLKSGHDTLRLYNSFFKSVKNTNGLFEREGFFKIIFFSNEYLVFKGVARRCNNHFSEIPNWLEFEVDKVIRRAVRNKL